MRVHMHGGCMCTSMRMHAHVLTCAHMVCLSVRVRVRIRVRIRVRVFMCTTHDTTISIHLDGV